MPLRGGGVMDASDTPITESIRRDTTTHTRLRGRWLWLARAAWVAIATLSLVVMAVEFPLGVQTARTVCTEEPCFMQLTEAWARQLQQLGIPVDVAAAVFILGSVIPGAAMLATGGLVFWRRSDDWFALLIALWLVGWGAEITSQFGTQPLLAAQPEWRWIVNFIEKVAGISLFVLVFYLFPNGRFVPRRGAWTLLPLTIVLSVLNNFRLFPENIAPLFSLLLALLYLFLYLFLVVAQVYRYLRVSTSVERQQTKWFVAGLPLFIVIQMVWFVVITPWLDQPDAPVLAVLVAYPIFSASLLLIPVPIAIGIMRYRLWDVDFIINRSLVYGLMTLLLGGVFVGGFFGLRALWDALLGGDQPVIAAVLPAVFVALIFNPTRTRLRGWIDRRLYHINVDYRKADTPTPSPVAGGRTLATQMGVFEHLEPIGRGGMAEIYKAHHPTLDKLVAIKILPPTLAKQADFRHRFEREARVVGTLKHPNIVQVYDFGESDGTYYMVLEYVQGQDLGEIIRRDAPLAVERVRDILSQVASALDYAHGQGLVHRDVKPSNVMIETPAFAPSGLRATDQLGHAPTDSPPAGEGQANVGQGEGEQRGRAVLMDFGIARILGGNTYLTATGTVGTFDYIAPEQIQAASNVDGRADVYALGVMAFQMLTGRLPFEAGHPAALLIAHLNQPPPDPRGYRAELPESAAEALLRAMSKKPEERFGSAGAFVRALG